MEETGAEALRNKSGTLIAGLLRNSSGETAGGLIVSITSGLLFNEWVDDC